MNKNQNRGLSPISKIASNAYVASVRSYCFYILKNLEAENATECIVKQRTAVAIALRHAGNDHAQGVGNLRIAQDGLCCRRA